MTPRASTSVHEAPVILTTCRSGGALAGSAWSWAAIPPIYLALVVLRTGGYAVFNVTAFAWLQESEQAQGGMF